MDLIDQIKKSIDSKTKPVGSLGMIEEIANKICLLQKSTSPTLINPTIVIFAGDHGISNSGVSKYPQKVTYQMVRNFLEGGAAINVFSRTFSIELLVVDAGVNYKFDYLDNLINSKIDFGTKNFINQKAMTKSQLEKCFKFGKKIIQDISPKETNIMGFGEMGIGNTSSATMIMSSLLDLPIDKCVGIGTGLDNQQLITKTKILQEAKLFHKKITDVYEILQTFGGFEIVQMCSAMLEAYNKNMIIMVDGFIASCAYLAAYNINPKIWQLVTGNKLEIYDLARQSYFAEEELGFRKENKEFLHTELVFLVDHKRHLRGVYNGTIILEIKRLLEDINLLINEKNRFNF